MQKLQRNGIDLSIPQLVQRGIPKQGRAFIQPSIRKSGTQVTPLNILNLQLKYEKCKGFQVQLGELSSVPDHVGKT